MAVVALAAENVLPAAGLVMAQLSASPPAGAVTWIVLPPETVVTPF